MYSVKRIDLDEVTIVAFKQNTPNREPLSISTLDNRFLKENEISGAKDLSSFRVYIGLGRSRDAHSGDQSFDALDGIVDLPG